MKQVLITGCSKGIGFGLVNEFLKNNCYVIAVSRTIETLKPLAQQNDQLNIVQADITNLKDRIKILNTLKNLSNLEINIVNNAAYGMPIPFPQDFSMLELKQHFETNLFAPLELIQNILKQNKVNKVLNISSGAAEFPLQSLTGYCTSKAAIHHAIKCLNLEYPHTAFANLRPGLVDTPLQERWRNVIKDTFQGENPYITFKKDNKLLPIELVAKFIFWVFTRPRREFVNQTWNIQDQDHHKHWNINNY